MNDSVSDAAAKHRDVARDGGRGGATRRARAPSARRRPAIRRTPASAASASTSTSARADGERGTVIGSPGSRRRRWWTSRRRPPATPGSRPSSSAASRLISDTTRNGPACISTWAITVSRVTLVTMPRNRLRADCARRPRPGRRRRRQLAWATAARTLPSITEPAGVSRGGRSIRPGVGPAAQVSSLTPSRSAASRTLKTVMGRHHMPHLRMLRADIFPHLRSCRLRARVMAEDPATPTIRRRPPTRERARMTDKPARTATGGASPPRPADPPSRGARPQPRPGARPGHRGGRDGRRPLGRPRRQERRRRRRGQRHAASSSTR